MQNIDNCHDNQRCLKTGSKVQNLALQNAEKPFGWSKMLTKQTCRMLDGEPSHYIQIAISSKTGIAIHMNREPVIYDELIQSAKKS